MAVAIKNAVCAVVLVFRHFSLSELNDGHRIGTIGVKNFDVGVAKPIGTPQPDQIVWLGLGPFAYNQQDIIGLADGTAPCKRLRRPSGFLIWLRDEGRQEPPTKLSASHPPVAQPLQPRRRQEDRGRLDGPGFRAQSSALSSDRHQWPVSTSVLIGSSSAWIRSSSACTSPTPSTTCRAILRPVPVSFAEISSWLLV